MSDRALLTVVAVCVVIALCWLMWAAFTLERREPPAPDIEAVKTVARANRAELRASHQTETDRLTAQLAEAFAELAAERRMSAAIVADLDTRLTVLEQLNQGAKP